MPRQSKDFRELLKYKQESQSDSKNLEEFKQKVRQGSSSDKLVIVDSPETEKMSDVLQEFIAPYRKHIKNVQNYRDLLTIAVAAWNSSLVSNSERQELINELLNNDKFKDDPELQQDIKGILNDLVARKKKYFFNNKRLITNFQLKSIDNNECHLSVASSLP
jgi:hypothetical protein